MGVDPSSNNTNFPQSQVEGEQSSVRNATTTFTADANILSSSVQAPSKLNAMLPDSSSEGYIQEIKTFLAKPVTIATGVFTTTDTIASFLPSTIPQALLQVGGPLYLNKVSGFLGFRATTVIRLQVNANRFQQGRYLVTVVHTGGIAAGTTLNAWADAHANTLVQRTQLPRIELDLNCDTEGIIRIPYVSSMNYMPLESVTGSTFFGSVAVVRISPYSPLVAPSGSATASYQLWGHFEDVELIMAAVPQSNRVFGAIKGKSITEKEQSSAGVGPVQSALIRIRDASAMFKPVPMISAYAGTLSWFADISANAASVFGWSKPLNLESATRVSRQVMPYYANVDNVDQSMPLTMSVKNQVDVLPGFSGTDVDEMDFSFVATIPAFVTSLGWNVTQPAGAIITEWAVTPNYLVSQRTGLGGFVITDYTPLQFVASHFSYWRGSLVFSFKLVKTEFHSGRLAFCFFPHEDYDGTISPRSLALSNYVHREIVDIRESSLVTIAIPYVSSSPYRPTTGPGSSIGSISVYVVDPLVAPSSVSSNITVLMEVAGGPDMEFAIPKSVAHTAVLDAVPQSSSVFTTPKPQAEECGIVNGTIGAAVIKGDNSINAVACIGEKISSFRSLLKSMNLINYTATPIGLGYTNVVPFAIAVHDNSTLNPQPANTGDLYSALGSCYALSRGGVRLKFLSNAESSKNFASVVYSTTSDSTNVIAYLAVVSTSTTDSVGNANNMFARLSGPQIFQQNSANQGVEIMVPQYHRYHSRANADHIAHTNYPYTMAPAKLSSRTTVTYTNPGAPAVGPVYMARGGGDDVNFGTFISVPPMTGALGVNGVWN